MTGDVDQLAELQAVADRARMREGEEAAEAKRRQRELTQARFALQALHRAAGAGDEVDAAEEERLTGLLAAPGVEERREDPGGVIAVDTRAEARAEGALAARIDAEAAVQSFARANMAELMAQACEGGEDARDGLMQAAAAMDAAERRWREVSVRAPRLIALAAAEDHEADELRKRLEADGWSFPPVPVGLDGQQAAEYHRALQTDPDALLPIRPPVAEEGGEAA